MQRVRFTLMALLSVLLLTFFMVACQKDNPTDITPVNPGDGGSGDQSVATLTISVGTTTLNDYFGKTDSVQVLVTAKDASGTVVQDAQIVIDKTGPGSIVYPSGQLTDAEGKVSARFVLALDADTTVALSPKVATKSTPAVTKTIGVTVQDVRLVMSATPLTQEVVTGDPGSSTVRIRVQNDLGVAVTGVPVSLQLMDGSGTLSEPTFDATINAYTSTLSVDAVDSTVSTMIRSFVNPTAVIIDGGGGGGGNGKRAGGDSVTEPQTPVTPVKSGKGGHTISTLITADTLVVTMTPSSSRVASIFVHADTSRMVVAPSESKTTTVQLVAKDENNNGVPNLQLHLRVRNVDGTNEVGSLSVPDLTDATGKTMTVLSTDLQYGNWAIEAATSNAFSNIWADTVAVITGSTKQLYVSSDTSRIAVYGTNGISNTQIHAVIRDQNGQPVQDGKKVFFLLDQFPWQQDDAARVRVGSSDGTGSPFPDNIHLGSPYGLPFDSSETNNGDALITLSAGSRKGLMRMRIWTYLNAARNDSIVADFDQVQIVAGPPDHVEIDFNPTGDDGGGAVWWMEVSARVQDNANNDVADSNSVTFSVTPDIAHIGDGFTGNTSPINDIYTAGVAFTELRYESRFTNQLVTIMATVLRGADGLAVTDSYELTLPIQGPQGVLNVSPFNFSYSQHPGPGYAQIHLILTVRDGHGHLINDQYVHFSPSLGRIYSTEALPPNVNVPQTPYAYTGTKDIDDGVDDDPEGVSERWLLITFPEGFPDQTAPLNTCTIGAEIVGQPDAAIEPTTIFLYQ